MIRYNTRNAVTRDHSFIFVFVNNIFPVRIAADFYKKIPILLTL
jgi:hypothetical protein